MQMEELVGLWRPDDKSRRPEAGRFCRPDSAGEVRTGYGGTGSPPTPPKRRKLIFRKMHFLKTIYLIM